MSDFGGLSDAMQDLGHCWNRIEIALTIGGCE
jgi:hypothetical protein